jgi:IPT/TIG domain
MLFAFAMVLVIFIQLFRPTAASAQPTSQYVYDSLRRLIAVYDASGNAAVYHYDAVGNLLSISNSSATQFTAIALSSSSGIGGSTVAIYGTDFCPAPVVQFNGITGTLVSSTSTQIVVTVPAGAATGEVTVTCGSNTVNVGLFTAGSNAPSISGFTPASGPPGTAVTISGQNYQNTPTNNNVQFNTAGALVTSASTTSLSVNVPPQATTGHISVTTPAGQAVSTGYFYATANANPPVSITSTIVIGGPSVTGTFTQSNIAVYAFDATAGEQVGLVITNNTLNCPTVSIYTPTGAVLDQQQVCTSTAFIDAQNSIVSGESPFGQELTEQGLPVTGTYTLVVQSQGAGQITLQLISSTAVTGAIKVGGSTVNETLGAGQDTLLSFNGTYGQAVSLSISNSTLNCPTVSIFAPTIIAPQGQSVTIAPNTALVVSSTICGSAGIINVLSLPLTGSYSIFVDTGPQGGNITLKLTAITSGDGTITIGGPPITEVLPPGRSASLMFTGKTKEEVSLAASNIFDVTDQTDILNSTIGINTPTGLTLSSATMNGSGFLDAQPLPAAGTYQLTMTNVYGSSIQVTVRLFNAAILTGSLKINGPSVTETVLPGQDVLLTFHGSIGHGIAVNAFNNSLNCPSISILAPAGNTLSASQICSSSGVVGVGSLPVTGDYTVFVDTGSQGGSISLNVMSVMPSGSSSACSATTGTISVGGTPVTETLQPNQCAFLSFSGSIGQQVSMTASNNSLNCPAVSILTSRNVSLTSSQICGASGFINTVNLPATGSYNLLVNNTSTSQSGSITTELFSSNLVMGTITAGGPSVTATMNAGQDAFYTFAGVAGGN